MMFLQILNSQMSTLPEEKERLLTALSHKATYDHSWSETEAKQASRILEAEKFNLQVSYYASNSAPYAQFTPMEHFFSFEECNVEGADLPALENYVCSLLDKMNKLSSVIQFSLSSVQAFQPKDNGRTFKIYCTF